MNFEVIPCTREHIEELKLTLREMDRMEIILSSGSTPEQGLDESYACSDECYAMVSEGAVLCVFGTSPYEGNTDLGIPWLLASDKFYNQSRGFARECREYIRRMHNKYPTLVNMVYAENEKAIRWLKWCGFKFMDPITVEPSGASFLPFYKELKNV
jgi:hypothetical protein